MDVLSTTRLCFWTVDEDPRQSKFLHDHNNELVFGPPPPLDNDDDDDTVPWFASVGRPEMCLWLDTTCGGDNRQCICIRPPRAAPGVTMVRVCDVLTAVYLFYQQEIQEVPGLVHDPDSNVPLTTKLVDYVGHPFFEGIYYTSPDDDDDTFTIALGS